MKNKFILLSLMLAANSSFAAGLISPSSSPLETGIQSSVKPNLMFILDDSGSMAWDYLGDQVNDKLCKTVTTSGSSWTNVVSTKYGSLNSCNKALSAGGYANSNSIGYACNKVSSDYYIQKTNSPTYSTTNFNKACYAGSGSLMNQDGATTPDIIFFAYDVNNLYYNPTINYKAGVTSTNASMGDQALNAAKLDIYSGSTATINLTKINEVYYCNIPSPTNAQLSNSTFCKRNGVDTSPGNGMPFDYYKDGFPNSIYNSPVEGTSEPFYYKITAKEYCNYNGVNCSSTQNATNPNAFTVRWCNTATLATQDPIPTGINASGKPYCQANFDPTNYKYPRYGSFTRINVPSNQYVNYANWYTYYRTRINSAKTSIGITFANLDNSKRIGFLGMNSKAFVPVDDFNQTQKDAFYAKLYAENPNSGTNLKGVVSAVGRYYANKTTSGFIGSISKDPVQYSCQQNFTMLATDGYWNAGTNGVDFSGGTLGNYDNTNSNTNYDLRSEGVYDGNVSGATGTLSDAALYYYKTPLRSATLSNCSSSSSGSSQNLCPSQPNVPISSLDKNPYIHMNFYAMSLGINGLMTYVKDYNKGTAVDLENIKSAVAATSGICSWTTGTCNWPKPNGDDPAAIDDLWHATLSGRGRYFSANNATEIISGLQDALAAVTAMTGSSSAAATSSPNITATNNSLYYTTYRTLKWDGEIASRTIDPNTGNLSTNTDWSARTLLNSKVSDTSDTRTIKFLRNVSGATSSSSLVDFAYSNMNSTEKAYFDNKANSLPYSQYLTLSTADKALADNGSNLVNYLRGQGKYEQTSSISPLYRSRDFVLGDIIDTAPQYVGGAKYNWTDSGYADYITAQKNRIPSLYVSSNDGMIHSFNAVNGQENWAIIPSQVMNKLYKLADENYQFNHQFFVDGTMTVMDTLINGSWKTILVAGMGPGGKGYVAVDITDPSSPVALWEICNDATICSQADSELGYSYSNPIITQRSYDKKWVVYVTSGYDNSTGKGILYELEVETGKILRKLYVGTGTGGTVTASNQVGLGRINAYFDDFATTNVAKSIYGGDLNGDMWKFDLTSSSSTTGSLLGTAKNSSSVAQPITTKPEIGVIDSNRIIYFGTGQYLNSDDQNTVAQQSMYAIKDTGVNLGVLRNNASMVKQTITAGNITSTASTNSVNWSTNNGWYFDFNSQTGERVNVDPVLVLGNINIVTNVPFSSICTAGGNSWLYQIDYNNGQALPNQSNIVAKKLTGGLTVGQSIVILNGPKIIKNYITDAQGNVTPTALIGNPGTSVTKVSKKVSWREFLKR